MSPKHLSPAVSRRQISLDPRGIKILGVVTWVVILLGFVCTVPLGTNKYSSGEIFFILAFTVAGLLLTVVSLKRFRKVSLAGDSLYLADARGDILVPLAQIDSVDEIGDRSGGHRTLRIRLREPIGLGKEFYFTVTNTEQRPYEIFSYREPHPLVAELREQVEAAVAAGS